MDSGMGTFPQPQCRFAHIHVDDVSPLPTSQGHLYPFTLVDPLYSLPEAISMKTPTSALCTSALLSGCIVRFGIPKNITSDRGTTFTSQLWTLANLLGITLHLKTAYNPADNAVVEHRHLTLKAALMSH
ncbi:uncharacterized protein [Palaemon carinicauda]|uniref:uncharacterized protein n=1 Tax=Palaemon carinicauda TaxID=392227 RepID=UPI0035B6619C